MTKIDIFSGFLGAGKTTLIKKLIEEGYKGENLVLIENEFGTIGIDGGFLSEAGIQINELKAGCICCSLVGDFSKALKEVINQYHPDRILIEPSGVGKLSDVIKAVQSSVEQGAVLNGFTTVVDASKCKMYMKNFGEFFNDQVEHAGCIILSHTDKLSDEKIEECVGLLREHNKTAVIVTTPWGQLSGAQILEATECKSTLEAELKKLSSEVEDTHGGECCHHHHEDDDDEHEHCYHHHDGDECCHHHDEEHGHCHHHHDEDECCHHHGDGHEHCHDEEDSEHHHEHHYDENGNCSCGHHHDHHGHDHHHADEVFDSWGAETAKKFNCDGLREILEKLSDSEKFGLILRAKGIVASDDGKWINFDYVPGEPDVRYGASSVTGMLCVIGSNINKQEISRLFGMEV